MLLEFRTKNFKSFKDEIVFKMTPAPKIKGIDYSVLRQKINKKEYKALPTAVIYGPNSSGKTNIIGAIEVLKSIISKGNIKNSDKPLSPNFASTKLELIPNIKNKTAEPVFFYIKFINNNILFEYSLGIMIGKFMEVKFDREILEEKLCINEKMIFNRTDSLKIGDIKSIEEYLISGFASQAIENIAKNNLNKDELFLTGYFKTIYSAKIAKIILDWFDEKLSIIYRADRLHTLPIVLEESKGKLVVDKDVNRALKAFGLSGQIAYSSDENGEAEPLSLIDIGNGKFNAIPACIFESFGTIRFMNIFPVILYAIRNGEVVVIDEFDASIHPMALMSLVNVFHNDDINTKGAQLIFNTHNPIFLNKNLFRRDEIKFIERDEETGISTHYSLSDFGTSGEKAVRNSSDYMKNYFVSQYGAIKNIDFTDVFMNDINEKDDSEV